MCYTFREVFFLEPAKMENYKWDMGTNAMVPQWMHVANQGCLLSHANLIPSILKERQVAKIFS